jgi:hypothetical protein
MPATTTSAITSLQVAVQSRCMSQWLAYTAQFLGARKQLEASGYTSEQIETLVNMCAN